LNKLDYYTAYYQNVKLNCDLAFLSFNFCKTSEVEDPAYLAFIC